MRMSLGAACLALGLLCIGPSVARADDFGQQASRFASGTGEVLFLVGGVAGNLLDRHAGMDRALRTTDSLLVATALAYALKYSVQERRPDGGSRDSFPSGHATASFAVAAMRARLHPRDAPLWYAGATLIGASRVALHEHFIHDVVAGALLGCATSAWEVSRPHGLLLTPWIGDRRSGSGIEVSLAL